MKSIQATKTTVTYPEPGRIAPILIPALLLLMMAVPPAQALVLQRVEVVSELDFGPSPDPFEDTVIEEVKGMTSADINQATFGAMADSRSDNAIGVINYQASAAIGQFGSVGLEASLSGGIFANEAYELSTRVIIESDEFVNLTGAPRRAVANFIIDGGELFLEAGNAKIEFNLFVESENLGNVPIATDPLDFPLILTGPQFFAGGLFEAEANGDTTFRILGNDIGATRVSRTNVDIPLSLQSLDLGILGPGDRMAVVYDFTYLLTMTGPGAFSEGMSAQLSDPLMLSNIPALEVNFTPVSSVPEPSVLLLVGIGLLLGALRLRPGRQRRDRADRTRPAPSKSKIDPGSSQSLTSAPAGRQSAPPKGDGT